jgi:hypothetical protein
MPENIISAEVEPRERLGRQAAASLQQLGFRVLHIGPTISVQAAQSLWEKTFSVTFESFSKTTVGGLQSTRVSYQKPVSDTVPIPEPLQPFIASVSFVVPPEFF